LEVNSEEDQETSRQNDVSLEGDNALGALGGLRARYRQQPSQPLQPTPLARYHKHAGSAKMFSALT